MVQTLANADTTLTRSHSNYLAQINIEITQTSTRTNEVVAKLTALAAILVPLNIVTGLWGMNVNVPGKDQDGLVWFCAICVLMFAFVSLMLLIGRHRGVF